ncbi:MAG: endonuclease V [Thermodesulforhabdaceae bacterium]
MRLIEVALKLQQKLAKKVVICPLMPPGQNIPVEKRSEPSEVPTLAQPPYHTLPIRDPAFSPWLVAATDLGIRKDSYTAAIAVYRLNVFADGSSELELIEEVVHIGKTSSIRFPYIPGFLSFREIPPLVRAFKKLKTTPHVILCDGQGIAHPRKIGLASHLGLILKKPSIGCAKNKLCGTHAELPPEKGSWAKLIHNNEVVGAVYRSRTGVKPIYISPGHLTDLPSSIALVELCLGRYRIPEPLRRAHMLSNYTDYP